MSFAIVNARAIVGITAPPVRVEVHLSNGLPNFIIVGLVDTAVRESRDRVRSALLNSNFNFPDRRITVNLSPADLPKDGNAYDLPIAIGILVASKQLPKQALDGLEFAGELGLTGQIRAVRGALLMSIASQIDGRIMCLSSEQLPASLLPMEVLPMPHLLALCAHVCGEKKQENKTIKQIKQPINYTLLESVRGQTLAKQALFYAAAGGHSILMMGSPGVGKSMLASCLPGLLPPLLQKEQQQVLAIHSVVSEQPAISRPFRSPHHTVSAAAMVGGGRQPRPGEVTLAHHGVLFLDELPEYPRSVLEALREPLEQREVCIARAEYKVTFPANFQLVAAMNPCQCGYLLDRNRDCRCTPAQVQRYQSRISGPLWDRIDMHVVVSPQSTASLLLNDFCAASVKNNKLPGDENTNFINNKSKEEWSTDVVLEKVIAARKRQLDRQGCLNSQIKPADLQKMCAWTASDREAFVNLAQQLKLSARLCHRSLRLARTVADCDGDSRVELRHLQQSCQLAQSSSSRM